MKIRDWLVMWFGEMFAKKGKELMPDLGTVTKPVVPKPGTPAGCTCDLSKPLVVPLVPKMGADDKSVNDALYRRWKAGTDDTCGGLPGDVRPLFWRPGGRTFGWKHAVLSGKIKIQINGNKMTIWCGDCEGARAHVIGGSDNEAPANGAHPSTLPDWTPIKPGVEGPRKHFAYFECR